jgi:hypothetical protein
MTRHVHADLLHALAEDSSLKIESSNGFEWRIIENPSFASTIQFRAHDPYRQFKEAIAAGKTVQLLTVLGVWIDSTPLWTAPVSSYRIKPGPVVKVDTQVVYYDQHGTLVQCTWHDDVLVRCEVVK